MNPLPSETLLVILDINSLYTNIPHGDGLQSCKEIWYSSNMLQAYTECLVKLLILVRKCNKFTCNVDIIYIYYTFIHKRDSDGDKMTWSYANIFIGK